MDGHIVILSEVSQTEKDKHHMISLIHMWNILKMVQMNLSTKQKQTHRHGEQTFGCQRGRGWEEERTGSLGLGDANYYI